MGVTGLPFLAHLSRRTSSSIWCASALVLALGAVWATKADASVYWSNLDQAGGYSADSLGRAGNDGSAPNNAFITGANNPCGTAVDGTYVYWGNSGNGTIGRMRKDGTGVPEQAFITTGLVNGPCGVAVDANYVYWANGGGSTTLGRATINGGSPDPNFVTGANSPCGVAVDASHIYWANGSGAIGRVERDGTTNKTQTFVSGLPGGPCGVAADSSYVYWGNNSSIGRVTLDGVTVEQNFITGGSGMETPAVDGSYIYWANKDSNAIGRAGVDGSNPKQAFVAGATGPVGVAVDPDTTPPAASLSSPGGKKKQKAKRRVGVVVSCGIDACLAYVNGVLEVVPSGGPKSSASAAKKKKRRYKLSGVSVQVPAGASATAILTIPKKAYKQLRKALKHKGKGRVKFKATVTDAAGNSSTATRTVKLKR